MTRLASVAVSCIVLLVLPSGLAGPACATKNYRQQQCIERCKAKWGYPGSLMGGDRWGSVMRKMADKSTQAIDAAVSQACGFGSSSADIHGAVAGTSESTTSTSSFSSSTHVVQTTTSSSSVPTTSSSTSSSSSSSSSFTGEGTANLFDGFTPSSTSTSTITIATSTSSTPTSITQEFTPTSEPPPPPPPTSTTSSNEATPTSDSGNDGNNGSGDDRGTKDQGSQGSSNSNGNSGSTSNGDIEAYLSAHNSIRAQHGAADLTWSDDAASKAQTWANNCVFEHSGGSLGAFGENLAAGTGSSYGISEAIKSWTDEAKDYTPSNPQPSHFTQVVWKGTTQVGCAVASCDGIFDASFGKAKFFVCEYFPQGNIIGQFATNVQA